MYSLIQNIPLARELKRKRSECDDDDIFIPPKRISPFLNTPKEKKDTKKKILNISVQKLSQIDNAEEILRKSVLINNTMKHMKRELRKDKKRNKSLTKDRHSVCLSPFNNCCSSKSFMLDDPFLSGIHDKITDDMTDTFVVNLERRLGENIAPLSGVNESFTQESGTKFSALNCETRTTVHSEQYGHCDPHISHRPDATSFWRAFKQSSGSKYDNGFCNSVNTFTGSFHISVYNHTCDSR